MNTEYWILCIFPAILLVIMLIKVKIARKGTIHEDFLSLEQSKILQGIAAVGIIFHHLSQYITDYGNVWKGPITIFSNIGIFFTTIFFFCSGYGLVISYKTKPDYLKNFFKKRIPAVLIPFMLSNVIYLVFVGLYFRNVGSVLEGIANFFGLILINTNTWFLVEILILYVAFYFIFKHIKKPVKALTVMGIFLMALITFSLLLGHDKSATGGHWFMGEWWYNTSIFFWVGMIVAQYYDKMLAFAKKHYKWLLPATIILFLAAFAGEEVVRVSWGYYQEWEGHPGYGAKAFTLIAQTVACSFWLLMILLIGLKVKWNNKLLILLGKISLELYIIHDIFKVHITISRYKREDWVVFLWVIALSIGAAVMLRLLHHFLIKLVTEKKRKLEPEEYTYEQKIKEKQRKKRIAIWATCGMIAILIVGIAAVKELYQIFVLPTKYYEEEVVLLANAEVGDEIFFGTLDLEGTDYGKDRIVWIVVDKQDESVLLVSKYVIASKEYHNSYQEITWSECNLRKLLNEDFLDMVFSKYEKEKILTTDINTTENVEFGTAGGVDTEDRIFILSAEEVALYFPENDARCLTWAPEGGQEELNVTNEKSENQIDNNCWWWVRNMGETPKQAVVIDAKGEFSYKGRHITTASGGVRPAMWVSCEDLSE